MYKNRSTMVMIISTLVLSTLAFVLYSGPRARALANLENPEQGEVCYAVADGEDNLGQDTLVRVDFESGAFTVIGLTGTFNVEAMAFQPTTDLLYAADADRLGVINPATGQFTPRANTFGSGNGAMGTVNFNDADGITFDSTTGIMYGVQRLRDKNAPVDPDDVIFQIDPLTGQHIPNAFGAGVDYVVVMSVLNDFHDIDDMTIDPTDGQMYAIANNGGAGDALVKLNKATGAETLVGVLGVDDMEGLTFDPGGQLLGTTGKTSNGANSNRLFRIDKTTGLANVATSKSLVLTTNPLYPFDYEAVDCLSVLLDTPTPPTPTPTEIPTATPTATGTPTAIHLLYFQADWVGRDAVTVSWATASEIGTQGYNLYRATKADFSDATLVRFEPARGGSVTTTYTWTETLATGRLYWYRLEEVVTAGGKVNSTVIASTAALRRVYVPLLIGR